MGNHKIEDFDILAQGFTSDWQLDTWYVHGDA